MQSDSVVRMASDFMPPAVRLIRYGLDLLHRQRWLRNEIALIFHPRAMRHIHLQPIRSMVELFPRGLACFHRTINDLHAFGHRDLRRVALEVVASRGRNTARDYE